MTLLYIPHSINNHTKIILLYIQHSMISLTKFTSLKENHYRKRFDQVIVYTLDLSLINISKSKVTNMITELPGHQQWNPSDHHTSNSI